MKKYLLTLVMIVTMFLGIAGVSAKESKTKLPEVTHDPINVYIFRSDSCGYCHSALEFLEENKDTYGDYFNLIGFEVNDEDNADFWQKVGDYFGDEIGSIPYIVIGDKYHATGFDEDSIGKELLSTIIEQYQNEDYVDVVSKLLEENELTDKVNYEQNEDFTVLTNASFTSSSESSSKDTIIIVGIFVVLIGGVAGLVIASRKK